MICVDASVAAKWVFAEELSDQAEALYRRAVTTGERIIAPPLLPVEVTNVIRQRMRRAKSPGEPPLSLVEATAIRERFRNFPVQLAMPAELHQRALELADAYGLPAVYDAYYLALAQLLGCAFWTADQNLVNTLQDRLPFVRWLGHYEQS
jgi:predicted nucleic acid-binding protein